MHVKTVWKAPTYKHRNIARKISNKFHLSIYAAQVLVDRGLIHEKQIKKFLNPKLSQLEDPFLMHDMKRGVQRIRKAIQSQEKITIYGDYDVDGITSVSIMYSTLKSLGANVEYFIPNRFKDGYGPNLNEYKRIVNNGTKLLITTDNGITGMKEITYAEKHGVDVIITDHHRFPSQLPPAYAIIMTLYPHHHYPNETDFCGAGVAFKIAQALLGRVPKKLLDLAALSVVSDSVHMTKENRVLETYGLKVIHNDKRWGLRSLARVSGTKLSDLTSKDLSFSLIPRLNSLGRLGDANCGVELLTTNNPIKANEIAEKTEKMNKRRQTIMRKASKDAIAQANSPQNKKACTLVIVNKAYHPGIVGIVASRLVEKFHKPSLVIGHLDIDDKKGIYRGSGRSIKGFDMFKAMKPLLDAGFMTKFGGHSMACGFSVKPSTIPALRKGLEAAGRSAHLERLHPTVRPDLVLNKSQISRPVLDGLNQLQPFGVGNEQPLVAVRLPYIFNVAQMGKENAHLSFTLNEAYSSIHVVAWHMGDVYPTLSENPANVELAGYIQINKYRGREYLQFQAKYIRHFNPYIPTKFDCNKAFKCLYRTKKVHYNDITMNIVVPFSEYFHISTKKAKNILNIFKELHLINFKDNVMITNLHPKPCKLSQSATYQSLLKLKEHKGL